MMPAAIPIIVISVVSLISMAAFMAVLLTRRWLMERRRPAEKAMLSAVTRSYLQRVGGMADTSSCKHCPAHIRLEAVSHIHLLLKGGERDRLMQMAELDGLLDSTLRKSHSWRSARRVDAIRLLQQFGSEACIARLRQLLTQDRSDKVKLEAAFALASLGALPPPRETLRILGMLGRKPNRLDRALMRSLAPHYADHLSLLLDDELSDQHRALIVDSLGWSGDLSIHTRLEETGTSSSPELRSAALRAVAKLGNSRSLAWVVALLDDPVPFVRTQAANSCASLGLVEAVPKLQSLLQDEDLWVKLRAEHALDVLVGHWPSDETFGAAA